MRKCNFDTKQGPVRFLVNEETDQIEVTSPQKGWDKKIVCEDGTFDGEPVTATKVKNIDEFCRAWFKTRLGLEKKLRKG